eukprot:m51a1_g11031 putative rab gtpase (231) ;mRNA; f:424260-425048
MSGGDSVLHCPPGSVLPRIDHTYDVILVGPSGAGKSALLQRLVNDAFPDNSVATIGVDFQVHYMQFTRAALPRRTKTVKMVVWDTAGQERYRSIAESYYHGAAAALLVYDASASSPPALAVRPWLEGIESHASPSIPVLVAANKADLGGGAQGQSGGGLAVSEVLGLPAVSVSARTGLGVREAFAQLARMLLEREPPASQRPESSDTEGNEDTPLLLRRLRPGAGFDLCC